MDRGKNRGISLGRASACRIESLHATKPVLKNGGGNVGFSSRVYFGVVEAAGTPAHFSGHKDGAAVAAVAKQGPVRRKCDFGPSVGQPGGYLNAAFDTSADGCAASMSRPTSAVGE